MTTLISTDLLEVKKNQICTETLEISYFLRFNGKKLLVKVIRKFFFNNNKSSRWHLGDYEKHDFFPFEGL